MAAAVAEAHRVLREGGLLLDIHPTDEPSWLEVWYAVVKEGGAATVNADNLDAMHRVPLGLLEHDPETRQDFTAATDVLADAIDHGWDYAATRTFEYRYFFDSLDELTDYFEDNHEHARASDELLERALMVMQSAPTTPKIAIIQKTLVAALRKT